MQPKTAHTAEFEINCDNLSIHYIQYVAILRDPRHHRQMAGLVPWLSFSQVLKTTAAWREAHASALDWHI